MAVYKFQVAASFDSILARDTIVNVPVFEDHGVVGNDPAGLCTDIAELFDNTWYSSSSPQIVVKAYDATSQITNNPPLAQAVRNEGLAASSGWPREVALCLSFRGEQNVPAKRGRLYLSINGTGQGASSPRPSSGLRAKALELAQGLANIGGVDVDWSVFSPTQQFTNPVKLAWVDDEWDTMRSRGMRSTTRETLVLDE